MFPKYFGIFVRLTANVFFVVSLCLIHQLFNLRFLKFSFGFLLSSETLSICSLFYLFQKYFTWWVTKILVTNKFESCGITFSSTFFKYRINENKPDFKFSFTLIFRRSFIAAEIGKETSSLDNLPYENYQYEKVFITNHKIWVFLFKKWQFWFWWGFYDTS